MHSYNTPPPFRFSTQQRPRPPRSSVARTPKFVFRTPQSSSSVNQFASTPRFVLSQALQSRNSVEDDINVSDDEPPSSFSPAPRRQKRQPSIANGREAVDDIEGDQATEKALSSVSDMNDSPGAETINEAGSDTEGYDIDAEFDILFPSTPSRHKRRRISPSTPPRQAQHPHVQGDQSSASDISQPGSPELASDLASPERRPSHEHLNKYETPTLKPSNTTSKQAYQSSSRPRFVFPHATPFHASQDIRDDVVVSPNISSTAPVPSALRLRKSKPHFILPHSPSPGHENLDPVPPLISIPEQFSPTKYQSRRDGQSRVSRMNFVGGGMAVETRGWILEMAAKVQQQCQQRETTRMTDLQESQSSDSQKSKYMLTTEVSRVRCGYRAELESDLNIVQISDHGGIQTPITVVQSHYINEGSTEYRREPAVGVLSRNFLLLGPPSAPTPSATTQVTTGKRGPDYPTIQKGSSIGVKKGFAWEIKIGCHNTPTNEHYEDRRSHSSTERFSKEKLGILNAQSTRRKGSVNGKWLVGVEWDILR